MQTFFDKKENTMKKEDGAQVPCPFEPLVDKYETIRIALEYGLGKFYIHPSQKKELNEKLSGYVSFGNATGYRYPIHSISEVIVVTREEIETAARANTFEEKVEKLTISVDDLVQRIETQTYNVFITHNELKACEAAIHAWQNDKQGNVAAKLKEFADLKNKVLSTPIAEVEKLFREGLKILFPAPFSMSEYQKLLMELAKAIIHHKWGPVEKDASQECNPEKVRFLTEEVIPAMMKRG